VLALAEESHVLGRSLRLHSTSFPAPGAHWQYQSSGSALDNSKFGMDADSGADTTACEDGKGVLFWAFDDDDAGSNGVMREDAGDDTEGGIVLLCPNVVKRVTLPLLLLVTVPVTALASFRYVCAVTNCGHK